MAGDGRDVPWHAAWQTARPELRDIRRSLAKFPSPPLKIMRVSQLDADLLDHELEHVLKEPVVNAIALLKTTIKDKFQPEMVAVLRGALHYLSIWNNGATYGSTLQNLKYRNEWAHKGALQSTARDSPITVTQKTLHGLFTVIGPYAYERLRLKLTADWAAPNDHHSNYLWDRFAQMEKAFQVAVLANFLVFLYNGKYRSLADRILGMRLVYKRRETARNISFEFLNRQLVWSTLTEFLLFILPIVNAKKIEKKIRQIAVNAIPEAIKDRFRRRSEAGKEVETSERGRLAFLPTKICPICYDDQHVGSTLGASANLGFIGAGSQESSMGNPLQSGSLESYSRASRTTNLMEDTSIHNAYETDCGHLYCYYCIASRVNSDDDWHCLRCDNIVKTFQRHIEIVEESDGDDQDEQLDH